MSRYPDQIDVRLTSATAFCRLRKGLQRVLKRLSHCTGRDWRPVCEVSNMEALCATVEADLAVVPLLASTVPNLLEVLSFGPGLPPLPMFHINLHLPRIGASNVALELLRHIRGQFAARYRRAA